MSLINIAGRDHILSPLGIDTKLIENLLPLGLEGDELTSINDLPASTKRYYDVRKIL